MTGKADSATVAAALRALPDDKLIATAAERDRYKGGLISISSSLPLAGETVKQHRDRLQETAAQTLQTSG